MTARGILIFIFAAVLVARVAVVLVYASFPAVLVGSIWPPGLCRLTGLLLLSVSLPYAVEQTASQLSLKSACALLTLSHH